MPVKLMRLGVMLSACLLTGCATGISGTEITDTACRSFKPISASKADTDPTKRQVIGHNKAWDAICAAKAERRIASVGWP